MKIMEEEVYVYVKNGLIAFRASMIGLLIMVGLKN